MSTPTLQTYYREKVVPGLQAKHAYKNVHQIPRLEKIVVTSCMGKHPDRKQAVEDAVNEIAKITGQKPSVTFARKSVANFKVREGEPLGARVTLRVGIPGPLHQRDGSEHPRLPRPSLQVL